MTAVTLSWVFLRAVLLSFSDFGTVPWLRDVLVLHSHVLTDADLNDSIAISQASPGPLGLYIVVVGYFIAGVPGALAGVLALATPAFLGIPMAGLVRRGQSSALQGRVGTGLLAVTKIKPVWVIVGAAAVGLLVQ